MQRTIALHLSDVSPTPATLRADPSVDTPGPFTSVNLGQLFQHYYFDSYPAGPPSPDPTSFEYLQLLAGTEDFRFHAHVAEASTTKKRGISTDLGQAFCRWALDRHFGIKYFAHMNRVLDKPTHPGFEGLRIERVSKGDTPDYLCARSITRPMIAEAKGRFSSVSFSNSQFVSWRDQFSRIRVRDRHGFVRQLKGYVVATRLTTVANKRTRPGLYIEDPDTPGEGPLAEGDGNGLGRLIVASHYSRVFRKLDLDLIGSALEGGFAIDDNLRFQVPVWTCLVQPLFGREFIGGFYRTGPGTLPQLTEEGWRWQQSLELGKSHGVFVGLEVSIARQVVQAVRGNVEALADLPELVPEGAWSSEFSWLPDGTVLAPLTQLVPTGVVAL